MIFSGSSWSARDVNWIVMGFISFLCWDTNCYYKQLAEILIRKQSFVFLTDRNKCKGNQVGVKMPQGANMVWCFSIGTSYILFNLRQGVPNVSAVLYDGSLKASGGVNEHKPVPQTLLLEVAQDDSYLS
ncbi:hypothetical protein C5167_019118 [Papaver somniferum]|uniref:Uncharacterized protein n=1 Tax=Papaver somniferum TaxID=3469 RepID=A0A4Y7ISC8_PAPSO|nr:hypothetical protein C5167_019118 [Papaver somniferum]